MSDFVFDLLVAWRGRGTAQFVFPSNRAGGYIQDPKAWIDKATKMTGIVFSMHDLRRTYATVAEACDIREYALKGLLNHTLGAGDVTASYIKMDAERLREPAQRVCDKLKVLCGVEPIAGANVISLR